MNYRENAVNLYSMIGQNYQDWRGYDGGYWFCISIFIHFKWKRTI